MALKIKVKTSVNEFSKQVYVNDTGLRLDINKLGDGGYSWGVFADPGSGWVEIENSANSTPFGTAWTEGKSAFQRAIRRAKGLSDVSN
jgi:hypothetical protein